MPVKIEQLVRRVSDEFPPTIGDRLVEQIIRSTLAALDMHVADNGEVYSPQPEPVTVINPPSYREVRRMRGTSPKRGRR